MSDKLQFRSHGMDCADEARALARSWSIAFLDVNIARASLARVRADKQSAYIWCLAACRLKKMPKLGAMRPEYRGANSGDRRLTATMPPIPGSNPFVAPR